MNSGLNAVHAYLLNIEESNRDAELQAGPSVPAVPGVPGVPTNETRNVTSPDPATSTQSPAEPVSAAELTQEV